MSAVTSYRALLLIHHPLCLRSTLHVRRSDTILLSLVSNAWCFLVSCHADFVLVWLKLCRGGSPLGNDHRTLHHVVFDCGPPSLAEVDGAPIISLPSMLNDSDFCCCPCWFRHLIFLRLLSTWEEISHDHIVHKLLALCQTFHISFLWAEVVFRAQISRIRFSFQCFGLVGSWQGERWVRLAIDCVAVDADVKVLNRVSSPLASSRIHTILCLRSSRVEVVLVFADLNRHNSRIWLRCIRLTNNASYFTLVHHERITTLYSGLLQRNNILAVWGRCEAQGATKRVFYYALGRLIILRKVNLGKVLEACGESALNCWHSQRVLLIDLFRLRARHKQFFVNILCFKWLLFGPVPSLLDWVDWALIDFSCGSEHGLVSLVLYNLIGGSGPRVHIELFFRRFAQNWNIYLPDFSN